MPIYTVTTLYTTNRTLGPYEADTPEDAIDQALLEALESGPPICQACRGVLEDFGIVDFRAEIVE